MMSNGWEKSGEYDYVICEVVVYLNQKKRDSDNLFKCLLDGINEAGAIYDDCMVIPRVMDVIIDSGNPRLEVTMYVADKLTVSNIQMVGETADKVVDKAVEKVIKVIEVTKEGKKE